MASKLNNRNNKIHTSRTLSGYVKYRFPTTFSPPGFSLSALCFSFLYFPLKNFSFRTSVFSLFLPFPIFCFYLKTLLIFSSQTFLPSFFSPILLSYFPIASSFVYFFSFFIFFLIIVIIIIFS